MFDKSKLAAILAEEGLVKTAAQPKLLSASKLRNAVRRAALSIGGYTAELTRLYKVPEFTKYEDFQDLGLTVKSTDPALRSMNKKVVTDFGRKMASKLGLPITRGPVFSRGWGWSLTLGEGLNQIKIAGQAGGKMSARERRYNAMNPEMGQEQETEWGHRFNIVVRGPKKAAPKTIPYYD
jgi:hypothetical protein